VSIYIEKKIFSPTFSHESMPVRPPAFSEGLALDVAAIGRRNGVFESGRSWNGIEIIEWPWALVTGECRPSWPLHAVVLLRSCRYPRMASRGERVRARPWKVVVWGGDRLLRPLPVRHPYAILKRRIDVAANTDPHIRSSLTGNC
jgi:hypothetical protein